MNRLAPLHRLPAVLHFAISVIACAGSQQNEGTAPPARPESTQSTSPFLNLRDRVLDSSGPVIPPPAHSTNEIRLGWFGPSGSTVPELRGMWEAASLAVEEVNDTGGCLGRPVRLIPRWETDIWKAGAAQVVRLIYEDHVLAIIGSVDGPGTHLAEQVVAKARVPLVSPVSSDPSVSLAGVPWMFCCLPGDQQLSRAIARATVRERRVAEGPLVILSATDHDSRIAVAHVTGALSEQNQGPDLRLDFEAGTSDFAPHLGRMEAVDAQVALIVAGPEDSATLTRALRRCFPSIRIVGTQHMGRRLFVQRAGEAAEQVVFPILWTPQSGRAESEAFVRSFRERCQQEPDYAEAFVHDATRLTMDAVRQAGLDRSEIRKALRELSPWSGLCGVIEWDGTGQNTRWPPRLGTIRDGVVTPLSEP